MFENIISLIEKHDSIIISGHKNPDGDCFGSAVALKRSISLQFPNKKVYLTGVGLPEFYDLLLPVDEVSDDVFPQSLGIIVDGNDIPRMEDNRIANCKAHLKIDHHVDIGSFKEGPQFVDEDANSTCDIITQLLLEAGWPIDEIVANALYLGILTDSGRFQFVIDYPETFDRVSMLCAKGANPKKINSILTIVKESTLVGKGFVFTHYKKSKHGVVYIVFKKEDLEKINMDTNAASSLVNLIGNIEDCPVWISFAEYPEGGVRIEIRSNGPEVQPFATKLGGGGHMYAAGAFMSKISLEEVDKVIEELDELVLEYKKTHKRRK